MSSRGFRNMRAPHAGSKKHTQRQRPGGNRMSQGGSGRSREQRFAYDDGALLGGLMGGAGGGEVRVGKIPFFNAFEDDFDLDKL